MQVCVSCDIPISMSFLRSLILLEEIKQLLERISKHCSKISVAKVDPSLSSILLLLIIQSTSPKQKETSQLADQCETLGNRLNDRSFILQQPNYDGTKRPVHLPPPIHLPLTRNDSALVKVEEQLAAWSRFNYPKSLSKFGSLSPSP